MFLRKSTLERLPVTMSGVRMGERVLQIGVDDPKVSGGISAKVGLSGNAAIVVDDERSAARARDAAAVAGVLVDVQVAPLHVLPFAEAAFDLVVLNSVSGLLGNLEAATREPFLKECLRLLRIGGRLVVIEAGARKALRAWLRPLQVNEVYAASGGAAGALAAAGFRAARLVGEREGYKFTEGLKG